MKRLTVTLALMAVFTGCASAPGSFTHDDFVWKNFTTKVGTEEAYKRIVDGGRRCIGLNHYRPVGYYLPEQGAAHFDIFLPSLVVTSDYVGGRVELAAAGEGTQVAIGTLRKYYNPKDPTGLTSQMEGYVEGKSDCWEPE